MKSPFAVPAFLLLSLAPSAPTPLFAAPGALRGVVVESVEPGSAGERSGFCPGDLLLSWKSEAPPARRGRFDSPFDLSDLDAAELPRGGALRIALRRGDRSLVLDLRGEPAGLVVRPFLSAEALSRCDALRQSEGDEELELRARSVARLLPPSDRGWLFFEAAKGAEGDELRGRLIERAMEGVPRGGLEEARLGSVEAELRMAEGNFEEAGRILGLARKIRERLSPDGLELAAIDEALGRVALESGDFEAAARHHESALAARERLAPGSLALARSYRQVGVVADERGDLGAAAGWLRKSLEIRERLAPGGPLVADSLNNLGITARKRGNLDEAESMFRSALAIRERLSPGGQDVAMCLTNLGNVAQNRGDLAAADAFHDRAREILERVAPDSLRLALVYNNLGLDADVRGDAESTLAWYRKALAIRERLVPGSPIVAYSYANLAVAAETRGAPEEAEGWARKALEIFERVAPDSLMVAASEINLAAILASLGDLDSAEELIRRSLPRAERLAPGSIQQAEVVAGLGMVKIRKGEPEAAEPLLRQALGIYRILMPGSSTEAESLWELGRLLRDSGRKSEALDLFFEATAALEAQQSRLGGSASDLATFRKRFLPMYRELLELLVDLGLPECGVEVFESARARAFLALLAQRELSDRDLSPELAALRRQTNADYRRALDALGEAEDEGGRREAAGKLEELRVRQAVIASRILRESPRLAALRWPKPLDLEGTRRLLEPGTLLLGWMVGEERSLLVALTRERLEIRRIDPTAKALRGKVEAIRRRVVGEKDASALLSGLSKELLGPAREEIASARRIVFLPDGPLWLLPFGLLPDPSRPEKTILATRPVSVSSSATLLGQLVAERRDRPSQLVGFGDPLDSATPGSIRRGRAELGSLPDSRAELESLRPFVDEATLYVGAEATEARAKRIGNAAEGTSVERPTLLHFAVHGLLDESRPLDSGVVLAIDPTPAGGGEDGILRAWEIFEDFRLDADLVVLSACETALGGEEAGEGIVGLTRAFEYAGARSVLASLWPVADQSTALLMARFYEGLRSGLPKDEALREAQLALAAGPVEGKEGRLVDAVAPFHWAAFQVYGDWK